MSTSHEATPRFDCTVVAVSFNSRWCIAENVRLAAGLNQGAILPWIVVENSPQDSSERYESINPAIQVVDGDPKPPDKSTSWHHAQSLHRALESVSTRYVVLIDPDYFVIRPEWVEDITNHMAHNKLAVFGSPNHPLRFRIGRVVRYVPVVTFLVIDLHRIPVTDIDMRPDMDNLRGITNQTTSSLLRLSTSKDRLYQAKEAPAIGTMARSELTRRAWKPIWNRMSEWTNQGLFYDTGHRLRRKLEHRNDLAWDAVTPAWENPLFAPGSSWQQNLRRSIARSILPDRLSPYPVKDGSWTETTFKDVGLPNILGFGSEEFFWRDYPFAFHIGSAFHTSGSTIGPVELRNVLTEIHPFIKKACRIPAE